MASATHPLTETTAIRRADGESRSLAASLPRLMLEARRIAANVIHGVHGRRRAGAGESFWQYRRFVSGEPPSITLFTIIGIPLAWILIALLGLWVGYRVVRGWIALSGARAVG